MSTIYCHLLCARHCGRPEIEERSKKYASIEGAPQVFVGCMIQSSGRGRYITQYVQ